MTRISMQDNSIKSIQEGALEFLNHCVASNYAFDTIIYYENVIHNFSLFLNLEEPVTVLTKRKIQEYQMYLAEKQLAEKTIKTYISGLRTVLYYFMEEGWIEQFHIETPKADEPIKEIYSAEEMKKLLKKPNVKKCSFTEYRNWAMVAYFIGTGQRENSVINIKIGDVDLESGTVILRKTKGRRNALLPLPPSLVLILKEYLRYRKGGEQDYLFCTRDGGQMTRAATISAIKTYNRSRGVNKTSIHLFRHSYAKNYLNNGGDVFKLKKLMTHSDLKSTERYLNLMIDDIQQNYREYNQLEKLMNTRIKMEKGRG